MDLVLKELMDKEEFSKDEFITSFRKHKPLNLLDPIWSFIIEQELRKYQETGAISQVEYGVFKTTKKARALNL